METINTGSLASGAIKDTTAYQVISETLGKVSEAAAQTSGGPSPQAVRAATGTGTKIDLTV